MTPYIVLMTLGALVIVTGLVVFGYKYFKTSRSHKLMQKIGKTSEEIINEDLSSWAKINHARFIPAALYKYGVDKLFEVDSIMITDKALIVIEIKSIKGIVKGDANAETFTKLLGNQSFPLTNPIKQNDKHIQHIQKMIQMKVPTISLIVYSNRAELVDVHNLPEHAVVIKHSDLYDTLTEINQSLPPKITTDNSRLIEKLICKHITKSAADYHTFQQFFKQTKGGN